MKSGFLPVWVFMLMWIGGAGVCAEPPVSADLNGNGAVNLQDFQLLSSAWTTFLPWWPDGQLNQMVAHWPLDGDAQDSQFILDGVCVGNPVWFTRSTSPENVKVGSGAAGFYGSDRIEIDASRVPAFFRSLTLDAWIKTGFAEHAQTIISNGNASWQLGVTTAGKVFVSCPGLSSSYLEGSTFVCDDDWHHVAAVYDSDNEQLCLYLDGDIDARTAAWGEPAQNNSTMWIADNPQTPADQWHGILDNIRLFNHACSVQQIFQRQTYHVDVNGGVDVPSPPNPEWGKRRQQAFKTIQHALDVASNGDIILVWPGVYRESLFFMGKRVTVRSAADAARLEPDSEDVDGIAVTFMYGEQADSILEHFVICSSSTALWIHQSSPTLRHLTIVNSGTGAECIFNSRPQFEHCIFWNNIEDIVYDTYAPTVNYSCLQSPYPGTGNISADPLFADPNDADPNLLDFHLQSETGRYVGGQSWQPHPMPENWVTDDRTSPCIDAGRPDVNPFRESMPNGGRINMGAYGNTPFAGLSPWQLAADMNRNGQVGVEDILLFSEQWLENPGP